MDGSDQISFASIQRDRGGPGVGIRHRIVHKNVDGIRIRYWVWLCAIVWKFRISGGLVGWGKHEEWKIYIFFLFCLRGKKNLLCQKSNYECMFIDPFIVYSSFSFFSFYIHKDFKICFWLLTLVLVIKFYSFPISMLTSFFFLVLLK